MMPVWIGTICAVTLTAAFGSIFQLLLWKTEARSVDEALLHHGSLWFVYFIFSAIFTQRLYSSLENRKKRLQTRHDYKAEIMSQLEGAAAERIGQLSVLIELFIGRMVGFSDSPLRIDITSLAKSNGCEVIDIALEIMSEELVRVGNGNLVALISAVEEVQRQLNKFFRANSREQLLRVQRAFSEFQSVAIERGISAKFVPGAERMVGGSSFTQRLTATAAAT